MYLKINFNNVVFLILAITFLSSSEIFAKGIFQYDAKLGYCHNQSGKPGLNPMIAKKLFHLSHTPINGTNSFLPVNAECVDFKNIDFLKVTGVQGYIDLINWNLRGANFNGAHLNLVRTYGDLSGADLSGAIMAYSSVIVIVDKYTKFSPAQQSRCTAEEGKVNWTGGFSSPYNTVCIN